MTQLTTLTKVPQLSTDYESFFQGDLKPLAYKIGKANYISENTCRTVRVSAFTNCWDVKNITNGLRLNSCSLGFDLEKIHAQAVSMGITTIGSRLGAVYSSQSPSHNTVFFHDILEEENLRSISGHSIEENDLIYSDSKGTFFTEVSSVKKSNDNKMKLAHVGIVGKDPFYGGIDGPPYLKVHNNFLVPFKNEDRDLFQYGDMLADLRFVLYDDHTKVSFENKYGFTDGLKIVKLRLSANEHRGWAQENFVSTLHRIIALDDFKESLTHYNNLSPSNRIGTLVHPSEGLRQKVSLEHPYKEDLEALAEKHYGTPLRRLAQKIDADEDMRTLISIL
ncbi:hypothetical protein HQ489_03310 [Candidatus Woesearchaeota archaeon]|nr:hypothetical protein [Candidatus Woesearchaeota archaeon]